MFKDRVNSDRCICMPNGRRRRRFCAEALYVRVLLDTAGWYCGVLAVPYILRPLIQQLLAYAFVDHSSLSTDVVKFPPAHSTTQYTAFTSVRFHNNKLKKKDEFANQSASNARLSIYTRHQQPPCRPSCSSDKPYIRAPTLFHPQPHRSRPSANRLNWSLPL